jgi:hypothetical protein
MSVHTQEIYPPTGVFEITELLGYDQQIAAKDHDPVTYRCLEVLALQDLLSSERGALDASQRPVCHVEQHGGSLCVKYEVCCRLADASEWIGNVCASWRSVFIQRSWLSADLLWTIVPP